MQAVAKRFLNFGVVGANEGKFGHATIPLHFLTAQTDDLPGGLGLKHSITGEQGVPAQKAYAKAVSFRAAGFQKMGRQVPADEKVGEGQDLGSEA